ncbi:cell wall-binding repeat-containing protein [Clostridium botulinum]|nr:cell wall-binding repeat-containing protein [Clostridium botulinum]MCS4523443.1 cell wall-binding repeat-containing protein [Clostridium botulinum]MCS4525782.1 cell wall-binding repeat-containing protein [Clostridium botulinum]
MAPVAAQKGMPILLTNRGDLSKVAKEFLDTKTLTESYVVGGTGVVSSKISSQLNNNTRLGGENRYETNSAVLNHFADKFSYDKVYVASGENYPDALSGSVLAAASKSPLVLVGILLIPQ